MATKAEIASARAARRARVASATSTEVSALNVGTGANVVVTPSGNRNILPRKAPNASPELVSVHTLPDNPAQKTDYLGNLYELPSDGVIRAKIQRLADTADRAHLDAAVKLFESALSGPQVHHRVPNATTGEMEYFTESGDKITPPKVNPVPSVEPAVLAPKAAPKKRAAKKAAKKSAKK